MELTVLLPAWNEEQNLRLLLPELERVLDALDLDYEILVVDGGSADGTRDVAEALGARVVPQVQPGYGSAIKEGFAAAGGAYVLTMDADYSHEPSFVKHLWQQREGSDLVIASRYVPGGRARMTLFRAALSKVLNWSYRKLLDLPYRDLSSGFRLYRMAAVQQLEVTGRKFDILPELLVRLYAEGFRIGETPFYYQPRKRGRSHAKLIRLGWAFLTTLLRMRRLRNSILSADYDYRAFDSRIPPQRYWQRKRHQIVTGFVPPGGRVLDVGCGSSRILLDLPNAVGMDVQLRKLRFLRDQAPRLLVGTLTRLPFPDECFRTVICSEVIEHVPKEDVRLAEFFRVLQPGGTLVLGTPDYSSWIWRSIEQAYAKVSPGGYAEEHINPYTREGLHRELEDNGFAVQELRTICRSEMIFRATKKEGAATATRLRG
ncbi:MAG: glycosyltransferase [Acidobacteriota bacterium]